MPDDWQLVRDSGVNVWLVGCHEDTHAVIVALSPHLQEAIVTVRCADDLPGSSGTGDSGTVILLDVDSFTLADQQRLHAWLDDRGDGVRIVSTARASIMPIIETGGFIESLYYRLNTVVLECRSTMAGSPQDFGTRIGGGMMRHRSERHGDPT